MCRMSLTFGIMLWVNFWLLFFPLPHCGFLTTLLGLPCMMHVQTPLLWAAGQFPQPPAVTSIVHGSLGSHKAPSHQRPY